MPPTLTNDPPFETPPAAPEQSVPSAARPAGRFATAAEWLHALGDVPLERIRFDPWPGTATEADLLRVVEVENCPCELIDGTLVEKAMGYWEGRIAAATIYHLEAFVRPRGLGLVNGADATMRLRTTGRIRLPDVTFVIASRVPKTMAPVPTLAPDLIVEVLSEGNTKREISIKRRDFFANGTRLAWIIDPITRTVDVYTSAEGPPRRLTAADTLDGGEVLPGFSVAVSELFADLPDAASGNAPGKPS